MNRVYRVVWSASLGRYQVASEVAGGHGGKSRSVERRRARKAATLAAVAVASLNAGTAFAVLPRVAIIGGTTSLIFGAANTTSSTDWSYDGANLSITGATYASITRMIGTILNTGTLAGAYALSISAAGNVSHFENNGLVFSTASAGVYNGGTLTSMFNSGSITATSDAGVANASHLYALTNTGTISGNAGVASFMSSVANPQLGTLTNSGTITGSDIGVKNRGATIGTIDNLNTGLILGTGTLGTGIDNGSTVVSGTTYHGTIGTINNAGTISGGNYGIYNEDSIGTINNLAGGLITGAAAAISNPSATATLDQINNAGTIAGNITYSGTQALSIAGASGAAMGTLTGFGGTSPGTLSSSLADLHFNGGNLLLNDDLNLAGVRTAFNDASLLQVNKAIQVSGNYAQAAGATLQIGVAGNAVTTGDMTTDSGYGRLVVSGNTTLAAGSRIALQSLGYSFAAGQRYVVIDTAGTAIYNEGSLVYRVNGSSTLGATGAKVANGSRQDLVVTVISNTNAGSGNGGGDSGTTPSADPRTNAMIASAPNAQSSLRGLLGFTGVSDAQLLNLYNAALGSLSDGSTNSANRVGKQLAPAQNTRAAGAATFDSLGVVSAHVDSLRVAQAGGTGVATGDSPANWGVWGQAFGGHASQSARDDVDGYSANYGGLVVGADRAFGDRWRAGAAFQFSRTVINNDGSTSGNSTGVNGYGLIGYAAYTGEPWYVNLSGSAVLQRYDTTRRVSMQGFNGVANGNFNGQQYVVSAEFGWPLALGRAIVTPLAGVTYGYLNQNGYTETGGNGSALTVGRVGASSVRSALGAKLALPFETAAGMWVPELSLRWVHEYNRTRQTTGASFAGDSAGQTGFTTVGATPVSNLAEVGVGVTLMRANNLSASIRYDLQAGSGFVSHTGIVRVQQRF
ncbi:autotransporter domain-containing protein [Pandoraea terrigena]|uniref:Autotransporter outer membrane beta-barrel domain-containing protein n=1 Tax=Pandoraea terrigena TaxID=2508292 RepID=A0A5E4Y451_9BURK|nr:autotransporter domain-containing protein [Pandoraea terrigena]VVE43414.1 autotransporter outer membrane beta-barrel domain-containing protein [Pandoraea terrigena]